MTLILASRPNVYTGNPLDRAGARRDDAAWIASRLADPASLFVPTWRARSLLADVPSGMPQAVYLDGGAAAAALGLTGDPAPPWAFLGLLRGRAVFSVDLSHLDPPLPAELGEFVDLRSVTGMLPAGDAAVLAHARGLMFWRVRHQFCGVCGAACAARSAGHVQVCTGCAAQHFPRTDPAVIMLVTRGERALLGHSQRFPMVNMFSALAGFVEPGESLEEAVAREVAEEAGITVGRVAYHSSQPWPFPSSIMLGFYAEGLSETIMLHDNELAEARWFTRAELRRPQDCGISLPRGDSIARRLIEDWIAAE